MNDQTDSQLLQAYAKTRSEEAFVELVRRHVDFVYSIARRTVCDSHLAEDVTQGAFLALAKNAGQLANHPVLAGWLHRTTQNIASQTVRTDIRRRVREQEAAAMNELSSSVPDAPWERIAPQLDEALGELDETDRDALLLRYFKQQSAQEMAQTLGISDEAAQKRVSRAVQRLRDFFSKRNVTIGASGLTVLISANAIQAAPVGLASAITATVLSGTAVYTSTFIAVTKTIGMTTIQKTIIATTLAVLAGAGIYEARQNFQLHKQNLALQQQQAPLTEQMAQLRAENNHLSNLIAQTKDEKSLSQAQINELMKLRGQSGQARTALQELAKLKSNAQQNGTIPASFTNAMAHGIATAEQFKKKAAHEKLARMREKLNLTEGQAQAIGDTMIKNIELHSQQTLNVMQGKQTSPQDLPSTQNEEEAIKALLSPGQLAAYPDFKQAETVLSAENITQGEMSQMEFSKEQQDKVHSALYQLNLDSFTSGPTATRDAFAQASATGNYADFINAQAEIQKQTLETKLKALDGILTPEQLKIYEQKRLDMIDLQTSAFKTVLPK